MLLLVLQVIMLQALNKIIILKYQLVHLHYGNGIIKSRENASIHR